jgi:AcrR family transcriptional regulator
MSPRGVAIPAVRAQLFRAAEQVLARDGPSGLSGRAITREAGCATGLLYNHFGDLDDFLTEFVADRLRPLAQNAAALPSRAGNGTVVGNLTDFALARLEPNMLGIVSLALSRPALLARLRGTRRQDTSPLSQAEAALTSYLDAEKDLGRISAHANTEGLALALLGTVHHLLMTHRPGASDTTDRMRLVVTALVDGVSPSG